LNLALKGFAIQKDLEIPRDKKKLCNLISSQIDPDDIKAFIHYMVILENPIRLQIMNHSCLKSKSNAN